MGAVTGKPKIFLHLEGLAFFAISTYFYFQQDYSWILFAVLFLAPDLFMLGYLINTRIGALLYNIGHTYTLPLALLAGSYLFDIPSGIAISLIWVGHIGFDRLIGYGLKYDEAFKASHLNSTK